jgi:dTDP-4-dehydrorhamnose reductase
VKIVLFGMNGQVGWELQRALAPLGDVVCVGRSGESMRADFSNPDTVLQILQQTSPTVIVNAAAYTAVDMAEEDSENAMKTNAHTPAILAAEAKKQGALLLHFSTEYVFDGKGERPWLETDVAAPLNVQNLIFRTSWVYASRGKNFLKTMAKLLLERDELSVVSDQVGAPTGAALLADIASHAIRATLIDPKLGGLYHVAAAGETSWYEYACYIASQIKTANPNAKIAQIKSILSSSYPQRAQRPINSRMNTEKFRTSFNLNLPQWRQGVDHSLKELLGQA